MAGIELEVMAAAFEAAGGEQVELTERQCVELQCALTDGAFVYNPRGAGVSQVFGGPVG